MPVSGGYYYPGMGTANVPQSSSYYYGGERSKTYAPGPLDVIIVGTSASIAISGSVNSVSTISGTLTATFGGVAQPVFSTVSGTYFQTTSSFVGSSYSIVFGPVDLSTYKNFALTIVNNSVNNLQSASLEWSPNNSQYEQWDVSTFAGLSSSFVKSMQVSGNSRRYFRVRAIPSGTGGQLSGSTDIYISANN